MKRSALGRQPRKVQAVSESQGRGSARERRTKGEPFFLAAHPQKHERQNGTDEWLVVGGDRIDVSRKAGGKCRNVIGRGNAGSGIGQLNHLSDGEYRVCPAAEQRCVQGLGGVEDPQRVQVSELRCLHMRMMKMIGLIRHWGHQERLCCRGLHARNSQIVSACNGCVGTTGSGSG